MTPLLTTRGAELGDFVEAYEAARASHGSADLADFLPPPGHPLRREVLVELARVDLEYVWGRDPAPRVEDYLAAFPELQADRGAIATLAFEEYRLRRQAGQGPEPDEYRRRFGTAIPESFPDEVGPLTRRAKASPVPLGPGGVAGILPSPLPALTGPGSPSLCPDGSDSLALLPATAFLPPDALEQAAVALWAFLREKTPGAGPVRAETWLTLYPGDRGAADLLCDLHRSHPAEAERLVRAADSMPRAGESFLNFRLTAEIGRGAFGRVFLARQTDLADRPVALKLAPNLFGESHTLAQLQHPHIVPVYSAHQSFPFQALCMPYLGSTTLAHVLQSIRGRGTLPGSGKELVTTLINRRTTTPGTWDSRGLSSWPREVSVRDEPAEERSVVAPAPVVLPATNPEMALRKLEGFTYVQAVLWIGARLADGLAHAHEHHILHRDLKPANVLLTDDGQPMLLDFNMAANASLPPGARPGSIGGTLPYMAPEHLEAFRARTPAADARSDIYSLGIILFEMLTGKPAFPTRRGPVRDILPRMIEDRRQAPPRARPSNPAVSPAVESILRRCLAPEPDDRYQTARELQEDLERQLADRPLKFARDVSPQERFGKWRRRHPRLAPMIAVALALTVLAAGGLAYVLRERAVAVLQARATLTDFRREKREAQFRLYPRDLTEARLQEGLAACDRALRLFAGDATDHGRPRPEESSAFRNLSPREREEVRREFGELFYLSALGTLARADFKKNTPDHPDLMARALRYNEAAETLYDSEAVPPAVWDQRADIFKKWERKPEEADFRDRANRECNRAAHDYYLNARYLVDKGDYGKALPRLEEACRLDPAYVTAWFLQGVCHNALVQYPQAIGCYNACLSLQPRDPWAWYNRGLVYLSLFQHDRAQKDFDRAIALKPDLANAYVDRAKTWDGLRQYAEAEADLSRALELNANPTQVLFLRSAVRRTKKDRAGADADFAEAMRQPPTDDVGWIARGWARLQAKDFKGALADFDEALKLNPRSYVALQNKAHILAGELRNDREAVRVLDQVVLYYPESSKGLAGRAVSLARLGRRDGAHRDARDALLKDSGAMTLYQVACVYALTSREHPADKFYALQLLSYVLNQGFDLKIVQTDDDLNPLRPEKEFQRLVEAARTLQAKKTAGR